MVYNDLVAAIRSEGGLHGRGDCAASIDIANDGSIFSVVAAAGCGLAFGLLLKRGLHFDGSTHFWYPCLKSPAFGALGIERDIVVCMERGIGARACCLPRALRGSRQKMGCGPGLGEK